MVLAWALVAAVLGGCGQETPVYTSRFTAFGSLIDLNVVGVDEATAQRVSAEIEADFKYLHYDWHAWDPGPLGYLNQTLPTGGAVAAPPSVLPMIRLGQKLSDASENLFNPAIGKLVELWGFHTDSPECLPPPPAARIQKLVKAAPKMGDLTVEGIYVTSSNPAVKLDFGAFGKGYGIDLAIEHLRSLGIRNAMINAGGDLRVIGDRAGQPWRIPLRRASGHGVMAILEVSGDESVFTSAGYQRNFVYEGRTYHHIIDPRTGYPADDSQSVTVIHTDAVTADAAATALFVAGPEDWVRIAERMGIAFVMLVDSAGTVHMTPPMAERVQMLEPNVQILVSPPLGAAPRR